MIIGIVDNLLPRIELYPYSGLRTACIGGDLHEFSREVKINVASPL